MAIHIHHDDCLFVELDPKDGAAVMYFWLSDATDAAQKLQEVVSDIQLDREEVALKVSFRISESVREWVKAHTHTEGDRPVFDDLTMARAIRAELSAAIAAIDRGLALRWEE